MKNRKDLDYLVKQSNLIVDIIGKEIEIKKVKNKNLKIGLFVWARNKPKMLFNYYKKLNNIITNEKLNVIIDDNCSQICMQIDAKRQKQLVEEYYQFFNDCNVLTSSSKCDISIEEFMKYIKNISYQSFYSFLPQKKKDKIEELNLGELVHNYLEYKTISYAFTFCDALFVGKKSCNIAYFYHRHIDQNANFIIVDNF